MQYSSSNRVRDFFWVPSSKKQINQLLKSMKWNLQTVVMEGRDRLSHPSGDDAVSTLREATRDKPTTTKVKVVGGSSLISWEWFKYRCRKNPDLFLSFFSNRWLCCVVARTVNLKHLRVNDRNVTEEKIERACISDSTLKSFDHLVSVSDCGALKTKKKREKTKRFGPGLILFLFFSTFKIISTNPALLSPVSPRERTKTVIRGQKQMQHQAVSQSEAEDFTHSWMTSQSFWN